MRRRLLFALSLPIAATAMTAHFLVGQEYEVRELATVSLKEVSIMDVNGVGLVPYKKLFEAYSEPGESVDEFMQRIGPEVAKFTDAGMEACGLVSTDGKRFGVLVGNQPPRQAWEDMQKDIPTDMVPTDLPLRVMRTPSALLPTGIPFNFVDEQKSKPGETLDEFVMRIAPLFDKFTAQTEWEACGMLAQSPEGLYGIRIGSIQAALSCVSLSDEVPLGMKSIGKTVHSHPRTQFVRPTYSDLKVQELSKARVIPLRAEESNKMARYFSDPDYNAGPGYLVHAGRVSYQEGRGTVRVVGTFGNLAPVRKFKQR